MSSNVSLLTVHETKFAKYVPTLCTYFKVIKSMWEDFILGSVLVNLSVDSYSTVTTSSVFIFMDLVSKLSSLYLQYSADNLYVRL